MAYRLQPLVASCVQALRGSAQSSSVAQSGSRLWTWASSNKPSGSQLLNPAKRFFSSNNIVESELKSFAKWKERMNSVPPVVKILGYAGVIPFILLTPPLAQALRVFLPLHIVENAASFQVSYGACIVSFLGAIHWGMAMGSTLTGPMAAMILSERYAWSVLPCLIAWPATQMHPAPGSMVMTALLPVVYYVDKRFCKRGLLPQWYMAMRAPLTAAATFGMATTASYYVYHEQERADQFHRVRQVQLEGDGQAAAEQPQVPQQQLQ